MKISVWGNGFVGAAVSAFFRQHGDVPVWDIKPERRTAEMQDVIRSDLIFLCLPTPTLPDGKQDLSALHEAVEIISRWRHCSDPILVVKSTVLPGVVGHLSLQFSNLRFVSNPEFLSARTAAHDFAHPSSIVLGGGPLVREQEALDRVANLHKRYFPDAKIITCDFETAAVIKYARNTFYATKVAFFNEVHQLCQEVGVDYEQVRDGVTASPWIDPMHTEVPGPDGKLGFGGACLPKDSEALAAGARRLGAPLLILEAAIASNKKVRDS